jgi:hypothetical protein
MNRLHALCLPALVAACTAPQAHGPAQPAAQQPATHVAAPAPTPAAPKAAQDQFGPTDATQDSLAPWSVTQTKLADNRWLISMRKRMFTMGGDGEPVVLLHLHAKALARQQGYREYVILSLTEGVQSDMPIGYRWARGEVLLRAAEPPMPKS